MRYWIFFIIVTASVVSIFSVASRTTSISSKIPKPDTPTSTEVQNIKSIQILYETGKLRNCLHEGYLDSFMRSRLPGSKKNANVSVVLEDCKDDFSSIIFMQLTENRKDCNFVIGNSSEKFRTAIKCKRGYLAISTNSFFKDKISKLVPADLKMSEQGNELQIKTKDLEFDAMCKLANFAMTICEICK